MVVVALQVARDVGRTRQYIYYIYITVYDSYDKRISYVLLFIITKISRHILIHL